MRFIGYLLLLVLVIYGLWPYYSLYRLDGALLRPDPTELATLVDLPAIRANYKRRLAAGVSGMLPAAEPQGITGWIGQNLERLGDAALEQAITLDWVRETLREAATQVMGQGTPSLIGAVDFAFFESHDRFLIRLGRLGENATHIRLSRIGAQWKITDII
ncbi:DUF2939 domain-containing protein [Thermochromatium tepidum]|uniref:DUF2939 domain-containing protein n=1 Tax=Thermochromatium tepidum ATCC 43061 TaxID=316276 RepID=A0A6I6EHZ0_THETI|nr:DUF2939 domain-containing protein [Thermochromatium tepidum]QGU33890.1 DUF2939 domain-containing protein [Thermochromatium tepidum ATCC 43061]